MKYQLPKWARPLPIVAALGACFAPMEAALAQSCSATISTAVTTCAPVASTGVIVTSTGSVTNTVSASGAIYLNVPSSSSAGLSYGSLVINNGGSVSYTGADASATGAIVLIDSVIGLRSTPSNFTSIQVDGTVNSQVAGIYLNSFVITQDLSVGSTGSITASNSAHGTGIVLVDGSGIMGSLTNNGTISGGTGIFVDGSTAAYITGGITNNGTISATNTSSNNAIQITAGATVPTITNSATGVITGNVSVSTSSNVTLNNSGQINGAVTLNATPAIVNLNGASGVITGAVTGSATTVNTVGTFATQNTFNVQTFNVASTGSLNLSNNVTATSGFSNAGNVTVTASSSPTITGTYTQSGTYTIGVSSPSAYGVLTTTGNATFSGSYHFSLLSSSILTVGQVYQGVFKSGGAITGFSTQSSSQTIGGVTYQYQVMRDSTNTSWLDLWVTSTGGGSSGAVSAADTQSALTQSATALRSVFNQQTALLSNSLNYDCPVFASHGVCVSGGGRFATTNSITGEQISTLLVAAYKVNDKLRVGAFIDQNASTPSVNGVSIDKAPMYGVFGVYGQPDGMGWETRVASSWSQQNLTQMRSVVGSSEAGVGSASLRSQALSGVVSYAMAVPNTDWVASPYAGLRRTSILRAAYTETNAVSTPLSYADLSQDITTALAGVRMSKKLGNDWSVSASVGVEQNIGSSISTLDASGVTGLTSTDFSAGYARTRPVASVSGSYAINKDQRISLTAMYRQEAFQSSGSTAGMVMYQVGF